MKKTERRVLMLVGIITLILGGGLMATSAWGIYAGVLIKGSVALALIGISTLILGVSAILAIARNPETN